MRPILLVVALLLLSSGCSSPCELLNGEQTDPAMQTCVASGSVEAAGPMTLTTTEATPVSITVPEPSSAYQPMSLPDGTRLVESYFGLSWSGTGGDMSAADSASGVSSVALAPDGSGYALGMTHSGTVRIVTASGAEPAEFRVPVGVDALVGYPNRATHLAYSPDGSRLVSTDALHNVSAWDVATGELLWSTNVGADLKTGDALRPPAFSPDGAYVATATQRMAFVWDATTGDVVARWLHPGKTVITDLSFASVGPYLAVRKAGRYNAGSTRVTTRDDDGSQLGYARSEETGPTQRAPTVFIWHLP